MKNLTKNCKTRECLVKSYLGESAARNKYDFFASIADKEGYKQISAIFLETALNEKAHAKRFYKFLGEEEEDITVSDIKYTTGISNSTLKNLELAAKGEHEENSFLYPSFQKIAQEEGYDEIADNYKEIIEVEISHERRFLELIENMKSDKVFKRAKETEWKCRNCGYIFTGKNAPDSCPSCKHPIGYFELFVKNY